MASFLVFIRRLFLIVASLFIILTFLSRGERFSKYHDDPWLLRPVIMTAAPFQKAYVTGMRGIRNGLDHYIFLVGMWEESELLKAENLRLREQDILFEKVKIENERLRELLEFKRDLKWSTIVSSVIAYDPLSSSKIITIDRGSKHGLSRRQPVISSDGLVGQVYRVGENVSQVLLITDPSSTVDAVNLDGSARGIVSGASSDMTFTRELSFMSGLEYVQKSASIKEGDLMVTSGLDNIYPAGIPIGKAHNLRNSSGDIFQTGQIMFVADLLKLKEVVVVTRFNSGL